MLLHYFDYHVFQIHDDPEKHLPKNLSDIATKLSAKQKKALRDYLINTLK